MRLEIMMMVGLGGGGGGCGLVALAELGRDAVEVLAALLGEDAATAIGVLLNPLQRFERLERLADVRAGRDREVIGGNTVAVLATIHLTEGADA